MQRDIFLGLACAMAIPATARADTWLVAETSAALAISDAQEGVFRPGLMPAIGAYVERSRFAFGLRLRAGILRDGPAPAANLADPGVGGLTTASLAVRMGLGGGWIELAGGGGVTGRDFVPAVEAGIGWSFAAGPIDIGPSLRYARVISSDTMDAFGTAELALVGIDARFGRHRPARVSPRPLPLPPPPPPRVEVAIVAPVQRDADAVVEHESSCADELDGCPLAEMIVIKDDRIVLDERVLFELNRARVRSRGRLVIAELAKIWQGHAEWRHVTIEGHADVRGTDDFNQQLSQLRADRVRALMIDLGCPEANVTAVGYGRTRPRDATATEVAHQRNRRVEFVIDRGGQP